jgi:hypothetical protein
MPECKKTIIGTEEWLGWNVGKGKRFKDLDDLLNELKAVRDKFGINCGYAGGPIDEEIKLIERLKKSKIKK